VDIVAFYVGAQPLLHDLASHHNHVMVGQGLAEILMLLDQQDHHIAALRQHADDPFDMLDELPGALQAPASSLDAVKLKGSDGVDMSPCVKFCLALSSINAVHALHGYIQFY
jgi:hypothetical protein